MGELLQFAYEFFKTGLFAVGGGLATLPFLYAMGAKTGWFTSGDVADVNFNAFFLDKIGPDQAVIGAISGAKENTVSKPVVGSSGVYLLNVTAKNKLKNSNLKDRR